MRTYLIPTNASGFSETFTSYTTSITFMSSGLPSWESWFVNLTAQNGTGLPSQHSVGGTNIADLLFNGTYTFTVSSGANYYGPSPASSSVTVVFGTPQTPTITFTSYTTSITFMSSGLPSWESWFVNLTAQNGTGLPSQHSVGGTNIADLLFNGTYTFTVSSGANYYGPSPASSSVTVVFGTPQTPTITFTSYTTSITFMSSGLPSWESWFVNLTAQNGTGLPSQHSVGGTNIADLLFNGTYTFTVSSGANYYGPSPASSSVTVVFGTPQTPTITFTSYTTSITFMSSGLPSWESWFVNLTAQNGTGLPSQHSVGGTNIADLLFNGTYTFTVSSGADYYGPSPASSSVTVVFGTPQTPTITFTSYTTSITFMSSGLPSWESWFVNLTAQNGTGLPSQHSVGGTNIADLLFNGTYTFTVSSGADYYGPSPASSSVTVVFGTPQTPTITFTAYTTVITFAPIGLPSWESWFVNLTAQNGTGLPSIYTASGSIGFTIDLFNHTYGYTISTGGNYYGANRVTHTVSITYGHPITNELLGVTFTPYVSAVTLTPSGLPSWTTTWFVNLTAGNLTHLGPPAASLQAGYGTAITFNAFNGTTWVANSWQQYYGPSPAQATVSGIIHVPTTSPQLITFTAYVSTGTLTPSGLPSWTTTWFVNLTAANLTDPLGSGHFLSAAYGTPITFNAFNGTKWVANSWQDYYGPSPATGTVSGILSVPWISSGLITFTAEVNTVTLTPANLGPWTVDWFVNLTAANLTNPLGVGNFLYNAYNLPITFNAFNGTKWVANSWQLYYGPSPAKATLTGITAPTASGQTVTFTAYVSTVTLTPSSLGSWTVDWFVNLTAANLTNPLGIGNFLQNAYNLPIAFNAFNGTAWVANSWQEYYGPSPATATVSGITHLPKSHSQTIVFTAYVSTVTLTPSGLPSWTTTWFVNLTAGNLTHLGPAAASLQAAYNVAITFKAFNGTTWVANSWQEYYGPSPATATVTGITTPTTSSQGISFTAYVSQVTLTPSGLPSWTTAWFVNLTAANLTNPLGSGHFLSAAYGTPITFNAFNGTKWVANSWQQYYGPNPAQATVSGILSVPTTAGSQTVTFRAEVNTVTLTPANLGPWTIDWFVNLTAANLTNPLGVGNFLYNVYNLPITFNAFNGTKWVANSWQDYYGPSPATKTVAGITTLTASGQTVTFTAYVSTVTLTPLGLPSWVNYWFVNLTAANLTNPLGVGNFLEKAYILPITFNAFNGTTWVANSWQEYYGPSPATATVSGITHVPTTISQTVTFIAYVSTVTLTPSGLPSWTHDWFVNLTAANLTDPLGAGGFLQKAYNLPITFNAFNGTTWVANSWQQYYGPSPATATVTAITSVPTTSSQGISFTAYVSQVTLTPSNLGPWTTTWFVNLTAANLTHLGPSAASVQAAYNVAITFNAFNGTTWVANSWQQYYGPSPAQATVSGILSVPTTAGSQTVTFTAEVNTVTLTPSNLGPWTIDWFVNLTAANLTNPLGVGNFLYNAYNLPITFNAFNNTKWVANSWQDYYGPSPATRTVAGITTPTTSGQTVTFTAYVSAVTLTPLGLPSWVNYWFVNLTAANGTNPLSASTPTWLQQQFNELIQFNAFNGTRWVANSWYQYYGPSPAQATLTGILSVPSTLTSGMIEFTAYVSTVTLTPSGLPSWTSDWFVNLTAVNHTNPLGSGNFLEKAYGAAITFNAFNGTTWVANSWQQYYGPSPATATVTGITAPTTSAQVVTFTAYVSTVTLTPSGLPSWTTTWFVNLTAANLTNPLGSGHFLSAAYDVAITFNAFNGTRWVANSWQAYYGPSPATATVSGILTETPPTTSSQGISFTAYVSTVTLTPTGLPSWTVDWFVNLTAANGTNPVGPTSTFSCSSNTLLCTGYGTAIVFNAFNGTKWVANSWQQYYGPSPATKTLAGIVSVPSTLTSGTIVFTPYVSTVTLTPSGLPAWTTVWFVNLTAANGTNPLSASTPTYLQQEFNEQIIFNAFNGTRWVTNSWQLYYGPSPAQATVHGVMSVPSTLTSGTILFTPYVSKVTLTPLGLPSWTTTWFVNLTAANLTNPLGGGHYLSAAYNAVIMFNAFNGTKWVANSWQQYYGPSPATQTVTAITTVPTTSGQTVTFTAYVSTVTLTPSGLPSWTTTWFVNLTAANLTHLGPAAASLKEAYNAAITFNVFNGTKWVVNSWQQYYGPSPAAHTTSGITSVPKSNLGTVTFTAYVSTVTLTPSGLPSWTTDWFVNLTAANGTNPVGPTSTFSCSSNTLLCTGYGTAIVFNAFNGTKWVANSWQQYYGPSPATKTLAGIVSVPSTLTSGTIVFTPYVSTVTLTPSGLPAWTTVWFVNLTAANGTNPLSASTPTYLQQEFNEQIIFNAFNGTRWVTNSWQLYYGPSPAQATVHGVMSVPSTLTSGPITFTPYVSTVTLTPSGLPSWTNNWFVNLTAANLTNPLGGGHFLNAAYNAVIIFNAFNGTKWVANSWQLYYGPSPAKATVTGITTVPTTSGQTVTFTAYVSTVTLTPSGLPSWTTTWFVNLTAANLTHLGPAAASLQAGYGTAITFNAFNGTKWVANSWQQYYGPHLATQTLSGITHVPTVSGSQTIVFTAYVSTVTLTPSGLPSWTVDWFVNLTAANLTHLGPVAASLKAAYNVAITFNAFNGTKWVANSWQQYYGPSPATKTLAGIVSVPSTLTSGTIVFTPYVSTVTLTPSGLPAWTTVWFVNLTAANGTNPLSASTPTYLQQEFNEQIIFNAFNGTRWVANSWQLYYGPSPAQATVHGVMSVPSTLTSGTITFTPYVSMVTLTPSGLPSWTNNWFVNLTAANLTNPLGGGHFLNAAYNAVIAFNAFNGTKWVANSWQQYYGPSPAKATVTGIVTVPTTSLQTVTFTAYVSTVTLTPSGLPSWTTTWFVNLTAANLTHLGPAAASVQAAYNVAITFNAFNGTKWVANSWQQVLRATPGDADAERDYPCADGERVADDRVHGVCEHGDIDAVGVAVMDGRLVREPDGRERNEPGRTDIVLLLYLQHAPVHGLSHGDRVQRVQRDAVGSELVAAVLRTESSDEDAGGDHERSFDADERNDRVHGVCEHGDVDAVGVAVMDDEVVREPNGRERNKPALGVVTDVVARPVQRTDPVQRVQRDQVGRELVAVLLRTEPGEGDGERNHERTLDANERYDHVHGVCEHGDADAIGVTVVDDDVVREPDGGEPDAPGSGTGLGAGGVQRRDHVQRVQRNEVGSELVAAVLRAAPSDADGERDHDSADGDRIADGDVHGVCECGNADAVGVAVMDDDMVREPNGGEPDPPGSGRGIAAGRIRDSDHLQRVQRDEVGRELVAVLLRTEPGAGDGQWDHPRAYDEFTGGDVHGVCEHGDIDTVGVAIVDGRLVREPHGGEPDAPRSGGGLAASRIRDSDHVQRVQRDEVGRELMAAILRTEPGAGDGQRD